MSNPSKTESIIANKSYTFALDVIVLYKFLVTEKKEFVMSKQFLRSGTSIGANVNEALAGQSKRDFIHKLSISLKESRETIYWLRLLFDSDYVGRPEFDKLHHGCSEISKILSSIILTTKERYFSDKTGNNS